MLIPDFQSGNFVKIGSLSLCVEITNDFVIFVFRESLFLVQILEDMVEMKLLVPPVDDFCHIYQAMYIIINEEFDAGSGTYQQLATKWPAAAN